MAVAVDLIAPLEATYGALAEAQVERYRQALARFYAHYGPGPVDIFRAPGRVNLIGEHTDYNHGYVLPMALSQDILLLARPRQDHQIRLANGEGELFPPITVTAAAEIPHAPAGHWSNYVRGAAQQVSQYRGRPAPGLDGLVDGGAPHGVPRGAGVSSSSALTVVLTDALVHYAGLTLPTPSLAQLCSDAEWYVGTRGGIMDQFVALMARRDHALFLDCRPREDGSYTTAHQPMPPTHRVLVVDSGVRHDNVRGAFNRRVAACRAGVALLQRHMPGITHLRDVESIPWAELEPLLPPVATVAELEAQGVQLGGIPNLQPGDPLQVRACCRHVWHENHRVLEARRALSAGDVAEAGRLLDAAHASARDDYQISTPELEILTEAARQVEGVAGARLTGAGWGGCIVVLVHADAVDTARRHLEAAYQTAVGRTPTVFLCQPGPGAGLVVSL